MPELPEMEITARRLGDALPGERLESAMTPGLNVLKTFDPPLHAIDGGTFTGVRRHGKLLLLDLDSAAGEPLTLLMHLMSAGRMQLFDKRGSLRDRTSRVLLRLPGDRELRLREFGTRQAAWMKLLRPDALEAELAHLGPEADEVTAAELGEILRGDSRRLHAALRDQRLLAGIGRAYANEILHAAKLSPYALTTQLDDEEVARLTVAMHAELARGLELRLAGKKDADVYRVHNKLGEPCHVCGTPLARVDFEEHTIYYCPTCQTDGRTLKDRRLSRLLR